jgi:MoxR-like ATPase
MSFKRIQFTPDLMPADIIGTNIVEKDMQGSSGFRFQKGPVFANLVLADEINRATPKTQSAMLEAMQEGTVTVGETTHTLPKPFFVIATQNPIEMEGTYPLPEAQLDRFLIKLNIEFPKAEELKSIVKLTSSGKEPVYSKTATGEDINKLSVLANDILISETVFDYAMKIISNTHANIKGAPEITKKYIKHGSSPRAAQALIKTSRIRAMLDKRYNVSFDDIKEMSYHVLRHRLILNFEANIEGKSVDSIIDELMQLNTSI